MLSLPPLSLYIHIPWCVRKCPYCDFNSHAVTGEIPQQRYIDALMRDLDQELPGVQGREIETIFIGGGTPSLFNAAGIQQILSGIAARTPLAANAEITMEANPGTFEQERFAGFRAAGVNRLSIGVQSFDSARLQQLGRIHNSQDAILAASKAREIGFDNFNLDLMHGLPQQTPEAALADLQQAIDLQPTHLSWYQLTIEPNTEFFSKPPNLPEDEALWAIQEQGQALLQLHGYHQYEISAYSQPNRQSRHNMNYWQFGDYLGIGAGAHGKISWSAQNRITRRWKQRQPKAYMNALNPLSGEQDISLEERPFEFMMNALRLTDGVETALFNQRTGLTLDTIAPMLQQAHQRSLLLNETERLAPSPQGRLFLNDLLELFLDD
ncbi:radical SAM family heme chaperone HemW [Amphritea sp. 2_MG-2023]|uniref:radical SAM family heme chaperone HemW n=1 Tax=Amphritea TaxID=515417 RepID=UPI001C072B17|nr:MULTISPECIES: radical SAM family heme chaperone HemW [Amphritea]MBU2965654.1 radical SAM family heme chaperone HemW [Amphritea atlantica]MDO6417210.1 radical SAM family heme chaperone HemW [Amphritea sp. 2_MG-2023]